MLAYDMQASHYVAAKEIIKAQVQLKENYLKTIEKFKRSLANSKLYLAKDKKELELQEITK